MRHARLLALTSFVLLSRTTPAAELTRVVSSFEQNDPLGIRLDVGFRRTQQRAHILREGQRPGDGGTVADLSELRFVEAENALEIDAHIGLWRDLEFHIGVPVVFREDRRYGYPVGVNDENSSAANNCLNPNGTLTDPLCPGNGTAVPLYNPEARVHRAGLGDFRFGLAYAIFNEKKDDTKPTWVVTFDYTAPTASRRVPTTNTSPSRRGDIGEKIHRYTFATAFSRRRGPFDPYMKFHYTLPYRGPGAYSNCETPDPNRLGFPENCGQGPWNRKEVGIVAPHVLGSMLGVELITMDEPASGARLAIDLRGIGSYVSESRGYNEISDLFGKLMKTGEYLEVGGLIGLYASAARYAQLNLTAGVVYRTDHFISGEVGGPGPGTPTSSANPTFDARVDPVSRRFRTDENYVFQAQGSIAFNF